MTSVPVSRPRISDEDIASVLKALKNTEISGHSKGVEVFERSLADYLGVDEVIAVSSGSTALDLAVEALEIMPGDECIVPTFTIVSTIAELARRNAKIRLIDADPVTWSMDTNKCLDLVSDKTKLILPVHIYGLPSDIGPIISMKEKFYFTVLEDAAEALGVEYEGRKCGTLGDLSTFSFYANKLITTGEGGAIATSNKDLSNKIRSLRNLNFSKTERFVHDGLGYNSRMSNLSAQLGISQLANIDSLLNHKLDLVQIYKDGLENHPWIKLPAASTDYSKNKYWVFGILLKNDSPFNAKTFQYELSKYGIESRRFFCPIHLQPFVPLYNFVFNNHDMEVSENLWNMGVYLPLGTGINKVEVEKVVDIIWEITDKC